MYENIEMTGISPNRYVHIYDPNARDFLVLKYRNAPSTFGGRTRHLIHICGDYYICHCWGYIDMWAAISIKFTRNSDGTVTSTCALPLDSEYFAIFVQLAAKYGRDMVLNDARSIYDGMASSPKAVTDSMNAYIDKMSRRYNRSENDANMFKFAAYHFYYGMVSEEQKSHTYVGRTIKMCALCDILLRGVSVEEAVTCMISEYNPESDWRVIRDRALDMYGLFRAETNYKDSRFYDWLVWKGLIAR